jgi:dynein heavy chain 1
MESQTSLTNGNHHDSPPATDPAPPPVSNFDPDIFRTYLLSLLPPVIGAKVEDLHSLFDDQFEERVSRFAADTGGVVYVVQVKEESEGV